ncbi:MAG: hypothetical protein JWN45_1745, partial [Acidobacteriaceae bacterium]|nr:hypothetical protein [Acidobacteriaceae bacterium]
KESPFRDSKIYVPVDLVSIATKCSVDPDIIFGRLYFHLNKKHGYKNDDGSLVHLFTLKAGKDKHCVNFPLLASLLAELQHENKKFVLATTLAITSLALSILSIVITTLRSRGR